MADKGGPAAITCAALCTTGTAAHWVRESERHAARLHPGWAPSVRADAQQHRGTCNVRATKACGGDL